MEIVFVANKTSMYKDFDQMPENWYFFPKFRNKFKNNE